MRLRTGEAAGSVTWCSHGPGPGPADPQPAWIPRIFKILQGTVSIFLEFEIKKDQFEYILHTFSVDPRLLKTKMANKQSESVEKVVHTLCI